MEADRADYCKVCGGYSEFLRKKIRFDIYKFRKSI